MNFFSSYIKIHRWIDRTEMYFFLGWIFISQSENGFNVPKNLYYGGKKKSADPALHLLLLSLKSLKK